MKDDTTVYIYYIKANGESNKRTPVPLTIKTKDLDAFTNAVIDLHKKRFSGTTSKFSGD